MTKVIVAGTRTFEDYHLMESKLDQLLVLLGDDVEIVSGCANGADKLGESYAVDRNFKVTKFPADWNLHGKSAGYIRNEEMAKYADKCIVFWDGVSKGTKHMIDLAAKHGLETRVIRY